MSDPDTLLVISAFGMPLYSARGITQNYTPIDIDGQFERSINGTLIDLSYSPWRKFKTVISCTDINSPPLDALYKGLQVDISCVFEFKYLTVGGSATRTAVEDSARIVDDYTFYRPVLTCLITNITDSRDEWSAQSAWQIEAEEK